MLSPPSSRHFIIRYDIRDTGRSTSYPPSDDGKANYTLTDLCNDALAILDYLHIDDANFVGFSMGGAISWVIAAKHPHRVKSVSLVSSSPTGPYPEPQDGLPGIDSDLMAHINSSPFPDDWHDKEQVVRFLMYFDDCMALNRPTEDEKDKNRRVAERVFDRAEMEHSSVQRIFNQAQVAKVQWPRELLKDIKCPTVIIHGRQDRNVPLPHAHALNQEIEGSKLIVLEDMAHEMPRRVWPTLVMKILDICC